MAKVTGRFEYDFNEEVFYFMPDYKPCQGLSPIDFHLNQDDKNSILGPDAESHECTPDECTLWFDYVGKGKSKLAIISHNASEA